MTARGTLEQLGLEDDDGETGIKSILDTLNNNPGMKPKPKLPEPDIPDDLTEKQKRILDDLPDKAGFYWVENIMSNERNIAFIDKSRTTTAVEHWGHKMDATFGGIAVIERWLVGWTILSPVPDYVEPVEYQSNENYGAF